MQPDYLKCPNSSITDAAHSTGKGGTGLGLSILKEIMLAYHGDISVYSEKDQGITFSIILPVTLTDDQRPENQKVQKDGYLLHPPGLIFTL